MRTIRIKTLNACNLNIILHSENEHDSELCDLDIQIECQTLQESKEVRNNEAGSFTVRTALEQHCNA